MAASFPVTTILTGWQERFDQFMSPDFFSDAANSTVNFTSTGIKVTDEATALITGDLRLTGVTKSVVLDTVLNHKGDHPMAGKPWMGFYVTATLPRPGFNPGVFAPFVGDEVAVQISVESMKAE